MVNKHIKSRTWLLAFLIGLVATSCIDWFLPDEKPEEQDSISANQEIYQVFKEWYLWDEQLPNIDPDTFQTEQELVAAIRFNQYDRWSYTTSYTKLMNLYNSAEYKGIGGGFKLDTDNRVKITHVYANSPLGKAGVERGWVAKAINGVSSDNLSEFNQQLSSFDTLTIDFIDREGTNHPINLVKTAVKINTVLHQSIIEQGNHKIGYLVFDSFLNTSTTELQNVFESFRTNQISDLIVDFRYNGGGVIGVANYMAGLIGGKQLSNKVIFTMAHNSQKSKDNKAYKFTETSPSPEMKQAYFITTKSTASASELVINNLSPYIDVKLVGTKTHGKPVGMYIFHVDRYDLAIVPVSFKNVNSLGYGDFFDGLPVQLDAQDDLRYNWGNPNETMLKTALENIVYGTIAQTTVPFKSASGEITYSGLHQIIQAY